MIFLNVSPFYNLKDLLDVNVEIEGLILLDWNDDIIKNLLSKFKNIKYVITRSYPAYENTISHCLFESYDLIILSPNEELINLLNDIKPKIIDYDIHTNKVIKLIKSKTMNLGFINLETENLIISFDSDNYISKYDKFKNIESNQLILSFINKSELDEIKDKYFKYIINHANNLEDLEKYSTFNISLKNDTLIHLLNLFNSYNYDSQINFIVIVNLFKELNKETQDKLIKFCTNILMGNLSNESKQVSNESKQVSNETSNESKQVSNETSIESSSETSNDEIVDYTFEGTVPIDI